MLISLDHQDTTTFIPFMQNLVCSKRKKDMQNTLKFNMVSCWYHYTRVLPLDCFYHYKKTKKIWRHLNMHEWLFILKRRWMRLLSIYYILKITGLILIIIQSDIAGYIFPHLLAKNISWSNSTAFETGCLPAEDEWTFFTALINISIIQHIISLVSLNFSTCPNYCIPTYIHI